MFRIGVFDSGVGGKSVANAIKAALPDAKVIFVNDKKNVPYGSKAPEELYSLLLQILLDLSKKCDVIVIACNSVSTTLINKLRQNISTANSYGAHGQARNRDNKKQNCRNMHNSDNSLKQAVQLAETDNMLKA